MAYCQVELVVNQQETERKKERNNAVDMDSMMSDAQFRAIVSRELNRTATVDEIAFLKQLEIIPRWREALVQLRTHAENQITLINNEMAAEQQRCLDMGPSGKEMWFRYKASAERRKASAGNFIRKVQLRLSQIRSLRQQEAVQVAYSQDAAYWRNRARRLGQLCNEILQAEIAKPSGNNWTLVQRIQSVLAESPADHAADSASD
jgi:hypothetical protein